MIKKVISIAALILIILGIAVVFATNHNWSYDEVITDKCLNFGNETPLLVSRVPIDDPREINREYHYNDSWIKKCR